MEEQNSKNCRIRENRQDIMDYSLMEFVHLKHWYYKHNYPKAYGGVIIVLVLGSIIAVYTAYPEIAKHIEGWLALLYYGHYSFKIIKP